MGTFLNNNWLKLVAMGMLLGAFAASFNATLALPQVYYQLMNWAVMGGALMIVWRTYKTEKAFLMWLFAIVAVIFNPIASIYLSAFGWQVADAIVIVLFIISFFTARE